MIFPMASQRSSRLRLRRDPPRLRGELRRLWRSQGLAPIEARGHRRRSLHGRQTINGLFKTKVIHRCGPWRSFEAVEFATLEWVDWFNHRRLLEPIGNIPPAEAEAAYYAQLEAVPIAA